jgi:hypothetical protein
MGQVGTDHPAANAQQREVRLLAEPLKQLGARSDDRLGVKLYDRILLGPDLNLCLLVSL